MHMNIIVTYSKKFKFIFNKLQTFLNVFKLNKINGNVRA